MLSSMVLDKGSSNVTNGLVKQIGHHTRSNIIKHYNIVAIIWMQVEIQLERYTNLKIRILQNICISKQLKALS